MIGNPGRGKTHIAIALGIKCKEIKIGHSACIVICENIYFHKGLGLYESLCPLRFTSQAFDIFCKVLYQAGPSQVDVLPLALFPVDGYIVHRSWLFFLNRPVEEYSRNSTVW